MLLSAIKRRAFPAAGLLAAAAGAYGFAASQPQLMTPAQADAADAGALSPKEFKAFKLIKKEQLTHNTYLLRYEMPGGKTAGLSVASCLVTKAMIADAPGEAPKVVIRPYTPTSAPEAAGYMDLVVKTYAAGKMSKHMCDMQVGESLEMKGPIVKLPYSANMKARIGMVAGGTGITPMLQVADAILANPADKTEVSLVFANVSEDDIILRSRIDELAAKHPNFKAHYIVSKAKWGGLLWKGSTGVISEAIAKAHLPAPAPDTALYVCGPPGFMAAVSGNKVSPSDQGEVSGIAKALGYTKDMVFKF